MPDLRTPTLSAGL